MLNSIAHDQSALPVITSIQLLQPQRRWLRFFIGLLCGLLFAWSNPFWQSKHLTDMATVHPDQTMVKRPVHQVPQTVTLIYRNQNGDLVKVPVHAERYSEWIRQQMTTLETARQAIRGQVQVEFAQGMESIFQPVRSRIPQLDDWYYSYGTRYQLLWESITSAISHLGADNLKGAVAADIEKLIQTQYEYLALKPELTDPLIQQLYQHTLEQAHQAYLRTLAAMEEDFQQFVATHTQYLESELPVPELHLDWVAQTHRFKVLPSTSGAIRGITVITIGAMTGKGIGLQVGTLLASRLALPFAERVVTVVGGSMVSAGTASLAGPLGSTAGLLVGTAVGFAVDWTINVGVELLSRSEFEQAVLATVESTQATFEDKLLSALQAALDVQYQDTVQLLLQF